MGSLVLQGLSVWPAARGHVHSQPMPESMPRVIRRVILTRADRRSDSSVSDTMSVEPIGASYGAVERLLC